MTDFAPLGSAQLDPDRILTSPTMYALYQNVAAAMRGLGANRPRFRAQAYEDLVKGNVVSFHDDRWFESSSTSYIAVGRWNFPHNGSVRVQVDHRGANNFNSELQIIYDGTTLGTWQQGGGLATRTVDIDNLQRGKRVTVQHRVTQDPGSILGSRIENIRFMTSGMNIMPAVFGYLYPDTSET